MKLRVVLTWKTVSMAIENELKFDGGVPSGKLNVPPKSCIPSRAKMRMKRKRRSRREMMDFIELSKDITKLRREDQYLEKKETKSKCTICHTKNSQNYGLWHCV